MQQARATQITAQHPELPGIHVMQVCPCAAAVPALVWLEDQQASHSSDQPCSCRTPQHTTGEPCCRRR